MRSNEHSLVRAIAHERHAWAAVRSHASYACVFAARFIAIMTLVALPIIAFPPRRTTHCFESKADIAKATVKKYTYEAYPAWFEQHPEMTCPASLDELDDCLAARHIRDRWGRNYVWSCSRAGMLVSSAGKDGRIRTADDIRSDE
ncbi:MAG: hypothetical protein HOV81_03025 [Kofleriaceae bacterium]|nr:hypothetical protein [Kofleriaceae bacterium]